MTAFRRLDKGGRIDRGKPVNFTYDGKSLGGYSGDTLASALLANGKTLTSQFQIPPPARHHVSRR